MKTYITKKKKTIIFLIASVLFFYIAIKTIQEKDLKVDVKLILSMKVSHQVAIRLDIDDQSFEIRIGPQEGFQLIDFKLPKKEIKKIRMFLGNKPGFFAIKQIKLKTLLRSYQWTEESIPKLFNYNHHIRKTYVEKGVYHIETEGDAPFVGMVRTLSAIINKVADRKLELYILAFLLSFFLFFMLYYFSLGNLKIFFGSWGLNQRVLVFLLLVFFPLLNSGLKIVKPIEIQERRALNKKPSFRIDGFHDYLDQYRRYYNDHFILRSSFIRLTNLMSYKFFKRSAVPMVIVGKNGWLFMSRETPQRDEVDYFRSVELFSRSELQQWCQVLEQRQQWLESLGIHYLLIIVPNKSTIYPEFMPDHIRKVVSRSRLDQLLDHINVHSEVNILDIRDALIKAKVRYPVFYKTDSHWNDYGAYIAYTEIMKYLGGFFKEEQVLSIEQFDIQTENRIGGDLAGALSLQKKVIRENILKMVPRIPLRARTVHRENISQYVTKSTAECKNGSLPLALMVHDSFIHELRPFLAEQFSRMIFIWDWGLNIYPKYIKKEKPWIVIEEMGERYLLDKILSNPEEVARFTGIRKPD
ncbi:MAG: hypothetical protein KAT17_06505 [Candidatus Aminicenantes bacterium]|nr:hypothetical protein [Candidatus Aminicenantes bacterium]